MDVEEVQINTLNSGTVISIINPYAEDSIHYLHMQIGRNTERALGKKLRFDLAQNKNQLIDISTAEPGAANSGFPFALSIGRFQGREDFEYSTKSSDSNSFIFAVAGAFEINGCLIQPGDALALWDTAEIEFEALSNNATLLVLEFFN